MNDKLATVPEDYAKDGSPAYRRQRVVSFRVFALEQTSKLRKSYPFLTAHQINCKVKQLWTKLSTNEKSNYQMMTVIKTPVKKSPSSKGPDGMKSVHNSSQEGDVMSRVRTCLPVEEGNSKSSENSVSVKKRANNKRTQIAQSYKEPKPKKGRLITSKTFALKDRQKPQAFQFKTRNSKIRACKKATDDQRTINSPGSDFGFNSSFDTDIKNMNSSGGLGTMDWSVQQQPDTVTCGKTYMKTRFRPDCRQVPDVVVEMSNEEKPTSILKNAETKRRSCGGRVSFSGARSSITGTLDEKPCTKVDPDSDTDSEYDAVVITRSETESTASDGDDTSSQDNDNNQGNVDNHDSIVAKENTVSQKNDTKRGLCYKDVEAKNTRKTKRMVTRAITQSNLQDNVNNSIINFDDIEGFEMIIDDADNDTLNPIQGQRTLMKLAGKELVIEDEIETKSFQKDTGSSRNARPGLKPCSISHKDQEKENCRPKIHAGGDYFDSISPNEGEVVCDETSMMTPDITSKMNELVGVLNAPRKLRSLSKRIPRSKDSTTVTDSTEKDLGQVLPLKATVNHDAIMNAGPKVNNQRPHRTVCNSDKPCVKLGKDKLSKTKFRNNCEITLLNNRTESDKEDLCSVAQTFRDDKLSGGSSEDDFSQNWPSMSPVSVDIISPDEDDDDDLLAKWTSASLTSPSVPQGDDTNASVVLARALRGMCAVISPPCQGEELVSHLDDIDLDTSPKILSPALSGISQLSSLSFISERSDVSVEPKQNVNSGDSNKQLAVGILSGLFQEISPVGQRSRRLVSSGGTEENSNFSLMFADPDAFL